MSAEAPTPINSSTGESLDLSVEIGIFIRTEGPRIKEVKEKEEEVKRKIAEAKAKEAHRKPPILERNELGKQIADQSNVRELITQAQTGLLQFYQAVQIGEVWSKYGVSRHDFETDLDRRAAEYRLDKIYGENYRGGTRPLVENHSVPSRSEHQSFFIRLGWRKGITPLDLRDFGYYYIDVECNPWFRSFWGSETLSIRSKGEHKVFKNGEWQDKEEVKKAILTVVKDPLYEGPSHADFSHPWKNLHGSWD